MQEIHRVRLFLSGKSSPWVPVKSEHTPDHSRSQHPFPSRPHARQPAHASSGPPAHAPSPVAAVVPAVAKPADTYKAVEELKFYAENDETPGGSEQESSLHARSSSLARRAASARSLRGRSSRSRHNFEQEHTWIAAYSLRSASGVQTIGPDAAAELRALPLLLKIP